MKRVLISLVAVSAAFVFTGSASAAEEYPTQEATVTITVSTTEGKVIKEETFTDTTKGADTTAQYNKLQKMKSAEQTKAPAPEKKEAE